METDVYREAGLRIREMRVQRGYTRDMVATLSGISPKFLYEIETGKKGFSAAVLLRIARALDVNCDYILTGYHVKVNHNQNLLGAIERFDEEQTQNLIQLLRIVYKIAV